jgi:hypothetical protein
VVITEQQKLGITVENVQERTVICTVSRTSCAFRAGMEEDCLVVALNEISTRSMCHKEVIDRLQQMHRPLRIKLRRVAPEKLQQRRAEMTALMHPHGKVGPADTSLEARAQTVGWAEHKLLSLVRLLAVGSFLKRPAAPATTDAAGGSNGDTEAEARERLWVARLLDILGGVESGFKRRMGKEPGVNERLRMLSLDLQNLVALFTEFRWTHRTLRSVRWHFIDLVCQALCVDAEASLSVSRDAKDLIDGPAITLLKEVGGRWGRCQRCGAGG